MEYLLALWPITFLLPVIIDTCNRFIAGDLFFDYSVSVISSLRC